MCVEIQTPDGSFLTCLKDIKNYGLSYIEKDWRNAPTDQPNDTICLCTTDIESILDRNGVKWRADPEIGYIIEDE